MSENDFLSIKTVDHWKAHSDWKTGRRYLTTFIVFDKDSSFAEAALVVQKDLAGAPVALCPADSLHQTLQGAGWEDELTFQQVESVRKNVLSAAKRVTEFSLTLKSLHYEEDAVWFMLDPAEVLEELREVLHDAVTRALGKDAPGDPDEILPHMTVAYCNAEGDPSVLFAAEKKYAKIKAKPYRVKSIDLIWLSRESDSYTGELVERCPLDSE